MSASRNDKQILSQITSYPTANMELKLLLVCYPENFCWRPHEIYCDKSWTYFNSG